MSGKVTLVTSSGNIVIDLYGKENPEAVREFLQNCIDKRYNGITFDKCYLTHLQTQENGNGNKFPWKSHSRVNFNRRGIVGLVNSSEKGKFASSDAFFITLCECPDFNNVYIPIGTIEGDLIYNVAKIQHSDKEPDGIVLKYPVSIIDTVVKEPFFDDLVPSAPEPTEPKRKKKKTVKLDYGDDDLDDGFKMSSAHDLLGDKKTEKPDVPTIPPQNVSDESRSSSDTKQDLEKPEDLEPAKVANSEKTEPEKLEKPEKPEKSESADKTLEPTKREKGVDPEFDEDLDIAQDTILFEELTKHVFT